MTEPLAELLIKSPDPRRATLDRIWAFHRLQFLMLGEGSTTSTGDHRGGESQSRPPKEAGEELQALEARWSECQTNSDRRKVLLDAQETLRDFKFPKADPRTIRGTEEWRLHIAMDERPMEMVTQFWGVSERTVYNYRSQFKELRSA